MPIEQVGDLNSSNQGYFSGGDLPTSLPNLLSNLISLLTLVAGVAFIFWFVIGAVNWITSAGDPNKAKKASQQILNAIIGLIITAIALPVLSVIGDLVGIPITDPVTLLNNLFFP